MRPSSPSSIPPLSASRSPSASFYERYETMFNCGGCIVEDDEPVAAAMYQQSSDAVDEDSNRTTEAISHWSSYKKERRDQESPPVITVTYNQAGSYDEIDKFDIEKPKTRLNAKEKVQAEVAAGEYFNRITNNNQPNIQMTIPISPSAMVTPQQRGEEQQEHATPIISNRTAATPSKQPSSPPTSPKRYDMFKVVMPSYRLKDRLKKERLKKKERRHHGGDRVKQVDSDCTQDTQSMSESDGDDDLSVDESLYGSEEPPPEEAQETLVSILRRKVKLGTLLDTKNTKKTTDDTNNRVRVRFEKDTKFPDPNEIPSPTRKHVPRMSQRQRQEYQRNHYQPTIQKQLDLSSLLMAAAGPSLVISTYNNDEFRDYSSTNNLSHQDSACRYQKRLARRAQQKQYQYTSGSHYRQNSSTAAEELLSHYYNQNEDVASFYAFR